MSPWLYPVALILISAAVMALEWWRPWRPAQKQLRPGIVSDLVHLVVNGHFLGVLLYTVAANTVAPALDVAFRGLGISWWSYVSFAASWPLAVQVVVALVVVDFLQWCVHNVLHRVSFLWEIHKVHHSIRDGEMDWIVAFRFHWLEVVVYKGLLYLPLLPFGFAPEALMFHAIFGTLIGHLNHANLNWSYGPLRYVLNSPRMHIWHHDRDGDERTTRNFGIIFSMWDWIFRTAKMPDAPPAHLGFDGDEHMPNHFLAHAVWPASEASPAGSPATVAPVTTRRSARTALAFMVVVLASPVAVSFVAARLTTTTTTPTATTAEGQQGASSQPASGAALAHSAEEAARALAHFGDDAAERGYAHPEHMVSVDELRQAMGDDRLVLLDVRPLSRFEVGHLPGARRLGRDLYEQTEPIKGLAIAAEGMQTLLRAQGVAGDSIVVVYGDGGPEPYRLWWQLRAQGLESRVLDGGLVAWKRQQLPAVMGPTSTEPSRVGAPPLILQPTTVPLTWAGLETFADGAVLLDTRSEDEFEGRTKHQDAARAGRIPGAQWLPWSEVLRPADQRLQ